MKQRKGFTLIELLITVVIVGLLASIAMPLAELAEQRNKEQDLRRALREIREALDSYKRASDEGRISHSPDASGFPPTLGALVDGVADAKSPSGAKLYFLRHVPRDPFSTDSSTAADATWGLRAYESPADAPSPGKDVFDVYSLASGNGVNGIPYKAW